MLRLGRVAFFWQEQVVRISHAMDTAEAEMDAAMSRTGDFLHMTETRLHSEVLSETPAMSIFVTCTY